MHSRSIFSVISLQSILFPDCMVRCCSATFACRAIGPFGWNSPDFVSLSLPKITFRSMCLK